MITKTDKNADRQKRHARVRGKISGTKECPRFNVFRSLSHIYVQIIDDEKQVTLVSCSTAEAEIAKLIKNKNKKDAAKIVGEEAGKRAKEKKIKNVVFDRGGYIYTGRIAAVAEGAREAGLKF